MRDGIGLTEVVPESDFSQTSPVTWSCHRCNVHNRPSGALACSPQVSGKKPK